MKVISLQSGSNGNCIHVEADGVRLLFDAGISGVQAKERLRQHGRDVTDVDALLISHDHSDHCRSMGIFHRKFGLPVFATEKTFQAASRCRIGKISEINHFCAGDVLRFGKVTVETFPTPHDAADGVVFVVDDGKDRLGILTDLGHVFDGLEDIVGSLDAVLLESNYDPEMLADGPYPDWLKERVAGRAGHISNRESAELLLRVASKRMKWACLAHISHENNTPDLALKTHRSILRNRLPLYVATRYEATDVLHMA